MNLAHIAGMAGREGLAPLSAFHPDPDEANLEDCGTLVLLGPAEPAFWPIFEAAPEYRDGRPDPLNRWSQRIVGALARALGGRPLFPFSGPPWLPFTQWARRGGQAWESPVGLLVHARAGLFVSYRGALALPGRLALPAPAARPCDTCARPCLTACPVGALTGAGYDLPACHGFLDTSPGVDCLTRGCAVRRACPVGRNRRAEAQSAFHMAAFHVRQGICDD